MLEQALVVYGRCLNECKAKIEKFDAGIFSTRAIEDRVSVGEKLARLAMHFLMECNFAKAWEAIELALSTNSSPLLTVWHAHVLMFLGRVDEAKELYLRCREQNVEGQPGATFILNDFMSFRRTELSHPLMDEIETLITARKISR